MNLEFLKSPPMFSPWRLQPVWKSVEATGFHSSDCLQPDGSSQRTESIEKQGM